jgi:importin subunit beta-1
VAQSFGQLVLGLQDASVCVRDTTAWTIGRIAQFHVSVLAPHLQELMQVLSVSFQDKPRVAAQVGWVIDALAEQMPGSAGEHAPSTALSPFFMPLVTLLLQCGARQDADEKNLRAAAYNALSNLISKAGHDCRPHMDVVLKELSDRLEASFNLPPSNELMEVQGSLIGCLQVLTSRMEAGVLPHAERLWAMYFKMFQLYQTMQGGQPCVHEEAVLATGALCTALGKQFAPIMQHFMPVLKAGLARFEEETVCGICVATLGDVARATEKAIVPYCEDILTVLYTLVNDPGVNRKLKPPIIQCFGDIALAAEGDYATRGFLGPVVTVLQQASAAQCEAGASAEWTEYISSLQESVLEAYTGIIHGLKAENKLDAFKGHVNAVLDFVQRIVTAQEKPQSSVVKSAVCVMGDLVLAFKAELAAYLASAPFMGQLVQLARACEDPKVLQDAQWLEQVLLKFRTG